MSDTELQHLRDIRSIVQIRAVDKTSLAADLFKSQYEIECFVKQYGHLAMRRFGSSWIHAHEMIRWASVEVFTRAV